VERSRDNGVLGVRVDRDRFREQTRRTAGRVLLWCAAGLQHTVAGQRRRSWYKALRDRAIRAAGVREVPLGDLAQRTGLKPETVRGILRHQPTSE
jgi:DNA-binding IclR family transcriptional regulator